MNMPIRRRTTRGGGPLNRPIIQGAAILAAMTAAMTTVSALSGCTSQASGLQGYNVPTKPMVNRTSSGLSPSSDSQSPPPPPPSPEAMTSTTAAPQPTTPADAGSSQIGLNSYAAKKAAQQELGAEAAATIPDTPPHTPKVPAIDPGAKKLVDTILAAIPNRQSDADGLTRIGISPVRNQSRCAASEFERFQSRLARLLTDAANDSKVNFTTDTSSSSVQYLMQGTAYLITADGFDQWELFLSLSVVDRNYTLWKSEGPVRVLRQERLGAPQVFGP